MLFRIQLRLTADGSYLRQTVFKSVTDFHDYIIDRAERTDTTFKKLKKFFKEHFKPDNSCPVSLLCLFCPPEKEDSIITKEVVTLRV